MSYTENGQPMWDEQAIAEYEFLTWAEKNMIPTDDEVDDCNPMNEVTEMLNHYYYQLGVCTHSLRRLERELTDLYAKHTNILAEIDSCLEVLKPSK